jgi:hypothetical protein
MIQLPPVDMEMVNEATGELYMQIKQRDRVLKDQREALESLQKQLADVQVEWAPNDEEGIRRRIGELTTKLTMMLDNRVDTGESPPVAESNEPVTPAAQNGHDADNEANAPDPVPIAGTRRKAKGSD